MKFILGITLILLTHGASPLSVDMPHGGCRLTVFENGGGTITFGAMPRWITVQVGTYDYLELWRLLRASSYPQAQVPIRPESGSVSLSNGSDLRSIEDKPLVRRLLERGWKARIPPASADEEEDHRWVSDACSLTQSVPARTHAGYDAFHRTPLFGEGVTALGAGGHGR